MGQGLVGPAAFVVLLVLGVALAPLTVLPAVALAASLFGVFWTAVLSVLGWTVGAAIAFLLGRHVGRPILKHFVSLERIAAFEKRIPQNAEFWGIVLLRMVTPVDLLSYALGLFSAVSFRTYLFATIIGVTPFSILFAYAGGALHSGSYLALGGAILIGLLLFFITFRGYARRYGTRR